MDLKDSKYQKLSLIGSIILLITILSGDFIPLELRFGLLGLATGWLLATWTLKLLINKDQSKKAQKKSQASLEKLQECLKNR
jgi:hypothetical protein